MTERLDRCIAAARAAQRPLLIGALVVGDPYLEATAEHMETLAVDGVDIIELIHPFSDPSYHGAVIQRASQRALREGVSLADLAEQCAMFREVYGDTPVIVSSYISRLLGPGLDASLATLAAGGVDALLVTDIPLAEAAPWREAATRAGLAWIPSIATTTTPAAIAQVRAAAPPLALWTGHIGGAIHDRQTLLASLAQTRAAIGDTPLIASMQISTPEEAHEVTAQADGILVGSALVWLIEGRGADVQSRLGAFVRQIVTAIRA
jgi:tryptophan synthase alpha chain